MTRLRALLASLALVATAAGAAASAGPGQPFPDPPVQQPTFHSAYGDRDYWLYVPPGDDEDRPLVVFLHGCNETALQAAQATHFDVLADSLARQGRGFDVLYPQQNITPDSSAPLADGNGVGCWNWFLPQNQQRDSGEPGLLAALTRRVISAHDIDPHRVYVEGVSAGADMSVILGATYPDVYAAVGELAGCAYLTCADTTGAATYAAMGSRARVVPLFMENGTADSLNNMSMAGTLLSGWLGADDLADDGRLNDSVPRAPVSVQSYDTDQTPAPGSGDLCIHDNTLTCPGGAVGFQGSYPYTVATYDDARGCDVLEFYVIHGMEHAHPDAPGDGPYTDPLGPDITAKSYEFFAAHPLPHGHGRPHDETRCSRVGDAAVEVLR